MGLVLGIDLGTSGLRGVLVARDGTIVDAETVTYAVASPAAGWTEQRPDDWWDACVRVLRALTLRCSERIEAIGLTGQMHGATFLDAFGVPIRNAPLWNDQRTSDQVREIERAVGRERYIAITGNAAMTGLQLPKILWLRECEPESYARVAHVVLPKDYLRLKLSDEYGTDAADAAGTGLFDVRSRDYSEELIAAFAIPRAWLPPIVEGPDHCGAVSEKAALLTGLRPGAPIVGGGGDNATGAIGAGVLGEPDVLLSIGTSGVILAPSARPRVDSTGALHTFAHAVPQVTFSSGVVLSAGGSFAWFRDTIAAGATFAELAQEAQDAPLGARGVLFAPYLAGERTPHLDPHVRGAWLGLSLATTRGELVRAIFEGVAFAMRDVLEQLRGAGFAPRELRAVGSGVSGALWREILCNVLNLPLRRPLADEGAAFGGAILAAVGAGWYRDVAGAVAAMVRLEANVERPDERTSARYVEIYARFKRLYPVLREYALAGDRV
jgi:xylulokinase